MMKMDDLTRYIEDKLVSERLRHRTNVIYVSDHGIDSVPSANFINLTSYLVNGTYQCYGSSPVIQIVTQEGYWPFNTALCNFWVTCDVLLCTSSIIHLLFISVTRYIGIRHPLTARRVPLLASRKAAMLKILVAWLLAAIISSPITILATIDTINIQPEPGICAINNRLFFTLGSIVSFFLPMLIMVNTYILTIRLLKRKANLCQKENASLQHQTKGTKPCVQCKVLVQDSSKRNNSKSSISSDYSTGLGTTTVKDLDYQVLLAPQYRCSK